MKDARQYAHFFVLSMLVLVCGFAMVRPDLAFATDQPVWGGAGGNYFRVECPKGSYLVGLAGRTGAWVDRIAPVCAPWLRGSQTFGAPSIGQIFGTSMGGQERHVGCWGSGVKNLAVQSWHIDTLRSGNPFVQYIEAHCISLALPASGGFWDFGSKSAAAEERVTAGPYGSTGPGQACPSGEAAVGIHGRAGKFLDALGLICGPLPAKLGAPETKVDPHVRAPVPTDDMFIITKPGAGNKIAHGQLIVAATPPKVGMTPVTELELRWLDAPPNQQYSYPYTTTFAVDTSKLLQGYPVAQIVTGGYTGRWQVRARASMKAVPGPWSSPVQFHLVKPQPSPPMVQTPLSSSSVTQAPSQSVGVAPPMVRPPTAPSHGPVGGTTIIRPRGIEPKGRTEENQTVDPAPEIQKEP